MTDPIRRQVGVGYKTAVKRTMVKALRAAFTDNFPEDQFQDLRIVPEFPLSREKYPAIYISYNGTVNKNAGVGHEETFQDSLNVMRTWNHRRFEGSIDFTCLGLTPLDRDILADALHEVLTFGWLTDTMSGFFDIIYGDPDAPYSSAALLLAQLDLNTDIITPGGESASPAPWEPEDQLLYQDVYNLEVHGSYYNAPPVPQALLAEIDITAVITDTGTDIQ